MFGCEDFRGFFQQDFEVNLFHLDFQCEHFHKLLYCIIVLIICTSSDKTTSILLCRASFYKVVGHFGVDRRDKCVSDVVMFSR